MSLRRNWRPLVAAALLAVAGALLWRSVDQTNETLAGARVCDAVREGQFSRALELSTTLDTRADHPAGLRDAVECRCAALEENGEEAACNTLLDGWLLDPAAGDWVPDPQRTLRWAESRAQQGRIGEAGRVLERLRSRHPDDAALTARAFNLRLLADDRAETLAELEARASTLTGPPATAAWLTLARHRADGGEHAAAYRTLLRHSPAGDDPAHTVYWSERLTAAADAHDLTAVVEQRDAWRTVPGKLSVANLGYAVALSKASLADPEGATWIELLERGLMASEPGDDEALLRLAWRRLIGHLTVQGRTEDALAALAQAHTRFPNLDIRTDEIQRSGDQVQVRADEDASVLHFRVDHPVQDAALHVSPGRGRAASAAWDRFSPQGGSVDVPRALDATPVRWVYRTDTVTYASGVTWPASATTEVAVAVREGGAPRAIAANLEPGAPGDGQRRIWVVFLDCGDWRLTSYLRQRGELPSLDALLRTGWRATPLQVPAFTAAAVQGLMHPELRHSSSTLAKINQLGIELGGLESIGQNPFAPLEHLLPRQPDLFQRLGEGEHRVANLIFAHGAIDGGRNASVTGPHGAEATLPLGSMVRALTPEESTRLAGAVPGAVATPEIAPKLGVIAAQFDALSQFQADPPFDLVILRIEALDPLTHQYFGATTASGQDDGAGALYDTYRYIDTRLGEAARQLDGDDMLIVMSDHGIQTSMVHAPVAMFVAWGRAVPAGRVTGTPALRGLSRALADLLGEQTDWPDYGLLPWAAQWRRGEPITLTESPALDPEAHP